VILPDTQKLAKPLDRKIAVVSLTKTISNSEAFVEKYQKGWAYTTDALLELLINPPVPVTLDDSIPDADYDQHSFGVGFTPLVTCKPPLRDDMSEVTDVKVWVGAYLKQADAKHGGRLSGFIQQRLSEQSRAALVAYIQ
jgi:exportin-2 (importin alpha re-exporter)